MATNLAEIQSYVPQIIVDKLAEYWRTHKLQSMSQAVAAALAEFFDTEVVQLDSASSSNIAIPDRVERLEAVVDQLVKQLADLEQNYCAASYLIHCSRINLPIESLQSLEGNQLPEPFSASLLPERSGSHRNSEANSSCTVATNFRSQIPLHTKHINQTQTAISSENWVSGMVTNDLVARLKTNPTTLKKYLRELKQIQWAIQRDPDGLGWIYDPLLERYYPVRMGAAHNASTVVSIPSDVDVTKLLEAHSTQNISFIPKLNSVGSELLECRGGLTQSQLSRLTNIPTNTLQRWKDLPDCLERIRCRTEGTFAYAYFQQNRRFYPLRSSPS
ncbi:hypothetical protein [Phormidesmis priestleyi]